MATNQKKNTEEQAVAQSFNNKSIRPTKGSAIHCFLRKGG
jgi:hypothetical protein